MDPLFIIDVQSLAGDEDKSGRGGGQQSLVENASIHVCNASMADGGKVVAIVREKKNCMNDVMLHALFKKIVLNYTILYFIIHIK